MVLTFLAMLFVMEQRIKYKEQIPLMSYNDARELLAEIFSNRAKKFELKIDQMIKRHLQRAKDILRYYKNDKQNILNWNTNNYINI